MMKWTFYFDEGNITTAVDNAQQHESYIDLLNTWDMEEFSAGDTLFYINPDKVKAVTVEPTKASLNEEPIASMENGQSAI